VILLQVLPSGGCFLGYFFGRAKGNLFVRRDIEARFAPPRGSRCGAAEPSDDRDSGAGLGIP